jgi:hypothetical protein
MPGRFARSRGAKQRYEFGAALGAARIQPLDQTANIVVAAKVNRGILFLEGKQTGIGRALRIPTKPAFTG